MNTVQFPLLLIIHFVVRNISANIRSTLNNTNLINRCYMIGIRLKKYSNPSTGMKNKIGFQLNAAEAVKILLNRLAVMITKTIHEMILKCGISFFSLFAKRFFDWRHSLIFLHVYTAAQKCFNFVKIKGKQNVSKKI